MKVPLLKIFEEMKLLRLKRIFRCKLRLSWHATIQFKISDWDIVRKINKICRKNFTLFVGSNKVEKCYRDTQKFSDTLRPMGGGDLKCILMCLYCNTCNKIYMWHSDTQNKFLFLFLILCSEFSTLKILIFGFEGWQLCLYIYEVKNVRQRK